MTSNVNQQECQYPYDSLYIYTIGEYIYVYTSLSVPLPTDTLMLLNLHIKLPLGVPNGGHCDVNMSPRPKANAV